MQGRQGPEKRGWVSASPGHGEHLQQSNSELHQASSLEAIVDEFVKPDAQQAFETCDVAADVIRILYSSVFTVVHELLRFH